MNRTNMGQQIAKAPARKPKPLYERPRPEGLKEQTMTPAEKAQAAKIAKGDKKVGLYARINAMRKVK